MTWAFLVDFLTVVEEEDEDEDEDDEEEPDVRPAVPLVVPTLPLVTGEEPVPESG